jgi:hypothetical protein
VCPQIATSGASIQRHLVDPTGRTGVFVGAESKSNDLAFAATQHREAPG